MYFTHDSILALLSDSVLWFNSESGSFDSFVSSQFVGISSPDFVVDLAKNYAILIKC